jgi:hypothetical protein
MTIFISKHSISSKQQTMRRQPRDTGSMGQYGHDGVYYVSHQPTAPGRLTATLAHAIADVANVDVTVAELAVGDRVDPAALDRLFSGSREGPVAPLSLTFELWGYTVTVRADGGIAIRPPADGSRIAPGSAGHRGSRAP